jgi:ABC-type Fe3+-hydroxamate transport system substrate-binding protein
LRLLDEEGSHYDQTNYHCDLARVARGVGGKTAALFETAEYQSIPAIKAGKVYAIPGKHITTTSHLIVNAVVDVQNLVAAGFR